MVPGSSSPSDREQTSEGPSPQSGSVATPSSLVVATRSRLRSFIGRATPNFLRGTPESLAAGVRETVQVAFQGAARRVANTSGTTRTDSTGGNTFSRFEPSPDAVVFESPSLVNTVQTTSLREPSTETSIPTQDRVQHGLSLSHDRELHLPAREQHLQDEPTRAQPQGHFHQGPHVDHGQDEFLYEHYQDQVQSGPNRGHLHEVPLQQHGQGHFQQVPSQVQGVHHRQGPLQNNQAQRFPFDSGGPRWVPYDEGEQPDEPELSEQFEQEVPPSPRRPTIRRRRPAGSTTGFTFQMAGGAVPAPGYRGSSAGPSYARPGPSGVNMADEHAYGGWAEADAEHFGDRPSCLLSARSVLRSKPPWFFPAVRQRP